MRIALFTDSDAFAGTERHMLDLALGLRAEGVEACIGCPAGTPLAARAAAADIPHLPIAKRGRVDWRAARTLARELRAGRIEIIHAHNGRTALAAALAVSIAMRGRLVLTQHFVDPARTSRRGIGAMAAGLAHRRVHRRADGLIAISTAVRDAMLARGDAPPEKIVHIPHGIAPPDPQTLRPIADVREELGVPDDAPLIVCAARLEAEKDLASLIAAMKSVAVARPDARCVIAGEGSLRRTLEEQIQSAGLDEIVRLLGFREDVPSLMHASDLFVLPSIAEAFGLVLLEAMALSRPAIAIAAGGPLEIVEHERTGLLAPPSDPAALAAAILRLIENPDERRRMAQAGDERYEREFTTERMAGAVLRVYQDALAAPTPPAGSAAEAEPG